MKQHFTAKNMKIMVAVGAIVCLLIFVFLIFNRYQSAQAAVDQLSSLKARLSTVQAEIEMTRKSIKQLQEEQEDFKKTLFEEQDVPAFLDGISNSASKFLVHVIEMKTQQFSQVTVPKEMMSVSQIAKVKIDKDDKSSGKSPNDQLSEMLTLASMPIYIKINGTFEAIVRFLNSMENYHQLLTVSNVEIVSTQKYPQLTCEFNLRIYSLKKLKDIKL